MAKKSMRARGVKRLKTLVRYMKKRQEFIETRAKLLKDPEENFDEILELNRRWQRLNRNASPVRQHRCCDVCGRPRAVYRKFRLCRLCLRLFAMRGDVPGVVKSSW